LSVNITCTWPLMSIEWPITRRKEVKHTANFNGGFKFKKDGLVDEYLPSLCAKVFDFVFLKLYWLAWSVAAH
jgi:hypothetical protein